jgi:GNAT superfamily N-acetyltransferase
LINTKYKIVEASVSDQKKIILLVNEAYWYQQQPFFFDIPASHERLNLAQLSKLMKDSTKKIFVLRCADDILGVIVIEIPLREEYAKFELFAIDRKYFGKRLGRLLIDYVENYAFEQGRKVMKIEVFTFASRLANYYKKLGYSFTGKAVTFFHDNCIKPEYQNKNKLYLNEMTKVIKNQEMVRS